MRLEELFMWPNRTLCDALSEMRKAYETRNFSYLLGLIEEVQSMGNKMESALGDKKDVETFTRDRAKLKKEIKELEAQKYTLEETIADLEEEKERKLGEIRKL